MSGHFVFVVFFTMKECPLYPLGPREQNVLESKDKVISFPCSCSCLLDPHCMLSGAMQEPVPG